MCLCVCVNVCMRDWGCFVCPVSIDLHSFIRAKWEVMIVGLTHSLTQLCLALLAYFAVEPPKLGKWRLDEEIQKLAIQIDSSHVRSYARHQFPLINGQLPTIRNVTLHVLRLSFSFQWAKRDLFIISPARLPTFVIFRITHSAYILAASMHAPGTTKTLSGAMKYM